MTVALSFAPLIVFTAVGGADWRVAAVAAIATLALVTVLVPPRRIDVLNGGMFVFFALAGTIAVIDPNDGVFRWLHPISGAWMCGLVLLTVAVGQPLTPGIGRAVLHPGVAESDAFAGASRSVSLRWAAALAVGTACEVVATIADRPGLGVVTWILAVGWAMRSTVHAVHAVRRADVATSATV